MAMLSVGKAFLTIVPDVSRLKTDLARSVDPAVASSMKQVGQRMQGIGLGMTAGITAPLAILGKQAFDAASQLQDVSAAAEVTFGKATPAVQSFADESLQAFGITETAALDAATSFAALGKSAGLQGGELAGFSTKMVGLAGDLSSFRGTSVEEALTAIGSGLRGEAEPLRKYGVLLDDATLRQEAMRLGLIKTTDEALTPQQKVLAAQSQIVKQTSDAQGDFARTADSAANSTKVMQGTMQEATASLGEALLPVITQVVNAVTPLIERFTNLPGPVKTVVVVLGLLLAVAGPLLTIIGTIITIAPAVGTAFTTMLGPVGLVILAIAAVVAIVIVLIKNWDTIKRVALGVWRAITGAVRKAWETIKGAALGVFNWLRKNWPTILAIITGPIGLAVLFVVRNWQKIKDAAAGVINWLRDAWRGVVGFIKDLWRGVGSFVSGVWDGITSAAKTAVNALIDGLNVLVRGLNVVIRGANLVKPGSDIPSIPEIPHLARGGIVLGPTLALLGEAGPEAVVPLGAGAPLELVGRLSIDDEGMATIRAVVRDEQARGVAWARSRGSR